jgi:hypothetical protein
MLMMAMNEHQSVGIVAFRDPNDPRPIPSTSTGTVLVQADNVLISRANAEYIKRGLLIKVGEESAFLSAMNGHSVLSINTGSEVLMFPLTDMPAVFQALDACEKEAVSTQAAVPPSAKSTRPTPTAALQSRTKAEAAQSSDPNAPGPNARPVIDSGFRAACLNNEVLSVYRRELKKPPTKNERLILADNADTMERCVPVWKQHCDSNSDSTIPGLNQICAANKMYTEAYIESTREIATGKVTFREYNARSESIETARIALQEKLFAIAQEYIDNLNKEAVQRQTAAESRDANRRQEETNALLRQLISKPPARSTFTNCNSSGDGSSVQCQTY